MPRTKKPLPIPSAADWDKLIYFPHLKTQEIQIAVRDSAWQKFRTFMLGISHPLRYQLLKQYVSEVEEVQPPLLLHTEMEWDRVILLRKIRVQNYVNALRRGGLIP